MVTCEIERMDCTSCGTCWDSCPDFFEQNSDDSFSQINEKYRIENDIAKGEVPADLEDCVKEAVDICPVQIIRLVD